LVTKVKKIFISSVIEAFQYYRKAPRDAIADTEELLPQVHLKPIAVHQKSIASSQSPQRAYLSDVRKCDVVLAILGRRYGYVNKITNLSAVEEECRYARQSGKDILIFVEECKKEPRQGTFVRRVGNYARGYKYQQFSNEDNLKYSVHRSLLKHFQESERHRVTTEVYDRFNKFERGTESWMTLKYHLEKDLEALTAKE